VLFGFLLVSCTSDDVMDVPAQISEGDLTPYLTMTPSLTPEIPEPASAASPTDIPAPTPTPFVYTVVENDTLTAIAIRHSVTLEDLIAANPGIDPSFLTIGLTLTIPLDGMAVSSALPTATPIPIVVKSPVCYPLSDGKLQCLVVVQNDQSFAVENIMALISLESQASDDPLSQTAITPLNWIPAGKQSVVVATFEAPFPQNYTSRVGLLTAIPIAADDQRYLQPNLQVNQTQIAEDGKQARVSGSLNWGAGQTDPTVVWVAAFAYDAQENIVGVRKWIANDSLLSAGQLDFDFSVYSLGPTIDQVEILAEVRP
jgi:LysM repeat protein